MTVHQFFCILQFCHTCSLCRVKLVVQFPVRGSTQVLLCLFLVWCGCDTSYIVSVHIQCQASIYTLSLCRRGPWMSTVVLYCWCHSDSASVLLYFTVLSHLFPLPCEAGSTVPREGFDSSVIMPFPGLLWLWHFLYSVGPHPVSSLHIYTFVVSRSFMAGAASQAGDADSSRAPGLTSGL